MSEVIRSDLIGRDPIRFGEQVGLLDLYDGLKTPFTDDIIELTSDHTQAIGAYASHAATQFGPTGSTPETTYAQTECGVPSLVVRIDCTVANGQIVAYEMEDSPSGQGITDKIHRSVGGLGIRQLIRQHFQSQVGQLPHVIVSGTRSHGTDDAIVFGTENYTFNHASGLSVPEDKLVIVKSIPGNSSSRDGLSHLQSRALAPLESEGDKTYLERIGSLEAIASDEELLRTTGGEHASQVLKSRIGSMAMGVSIYLHPDDRQRFGKRGTVTLGRLTRDINEFTQHKGGAFVQVFIPPIQLENSENRQNAIMRVFALLSRENDTIRSKVIGGCFVARPELVVHGASNAISGAVIVPAEGEVC